jgi:hypothetical protein
MSGALRVIQGGAAPAVAVRNDAAGANDRMVVALREIGLHPQRDDNGELVGFGIIRNGEIDEGERARLLERVDLAMQPCTPDLVTGEVEILRETLHAPKGFNTRTLMVLLSEVLQEYPADVVKTACKDQRRSSKFLPTEAEMVARCEALIRPRRLAYEALQPLAGYPQEWRLRLEMWERSGRKKWIGFWGPEPGDPRCHVPAGLLRHYRVEERPERPSPSQEEKRIVAELVAAWRMPGAGAEMGDEGNA